MPNISLPITTCPDGAGSLNNSANANNFDVNGVGSAQTAAPGKYVAPELCVGTDDLLW